MRPPVLRVVLAALLLAACGELKQGEGESVPPDGGDVEAPEDGGVAAPPSGGDASSPPPPSPPSGGSVTVARIIEGRSRPGARTQAGFPAWRGGLAATDAAIYWVESGANPGLYSAPHAGCATDCTKLATLVRPSVVSTTDSDLFLADVKTIKRMPLAGGALDTVASSATEVIGLAPVSGAVFWTVEAGDIQRTVLGGATSTPIYSNGTPVAMAPAGDYVFWIGADISGLNGALQRIKTDGTKPAAVSAQTGPFFAMRGAPNGFLYFARGNPAELRRIGPTGQEEVVASNLMRISDVAFDAEYAYFTEEGASPDFLAGRVQRVRHDDTKLEVLATSLPRPVAIAVRGKEVFVASAGTSAASYADGAIVRLTLSP